MCTTGHRGIDTTALWIKLEFSILGLFTSVVGMHVSAVNVLVENRICGLAPVCAGLGRSALRGGRQIRLRPRTLADLFIKIIV